MLARWCAATLPRDRFRALTCLVSLDFTGVGLAIAVTPRPFEVEQDVDLDFQIVDQASGQPIGAAFLRMTDPFNSKMIPPNAFTGADGRAELTGRFRASGQRNAFQTMGVFSPWGRWLEVSAPDYQTVRIPLPEVMGPHIDLERRRLRTVSLTAGRTPEGSLDDIAGIYDYGSNALGAWRLEILGDGRFAWFAAGCSGPYLQEYGYLKRNDGEIQLVPIPHPGKESGMTSKFKVIEWGSRMYLSTTDDHDLQSFCREALIPNHLTNSTETYRGCLRVSDREKPRIGLPRLPAKVWVKFLLDEMSLRNEEGSLRLALKSLTPRTSANEQVPAP